MSRVFTFIYWEAQRRLQKTLVSGQGFSRFSCIFGGWGKYDRHKKFKYRVFCIWFAYFLIYLLQCYWLYWVTPRFRFLKRWLVLQGRTFHDWVYMEDQWGGLSQSVREKQWTGWTSEGTTDLLHWVSLDGWKDGWLMDGRHFLFF